MHNFISNRLSAIAGGRDNQIADASPLTLDGDDTGSFIGGGLENLVTEGVSVIAGGRHNQLTNVLESIVGGKNNFSEQLGTFIGGGDSNRIEGVNTGWDTTGVGESVIAGGQFNKIASASYAVIAGGKVNTIVEGADYSSISGGWRNFVQGPFCAISGGDSNYINATGADHNFIGGGYANVEDNPSFGVIGGGWTNHLTYNAWSSSVVGGGYNTVESSRGFIGGGWNNTIGTSTLYSSIVGGDSNNILDGQYYQFLGGGHGNTSHGNYTTVGGGFSNAAHTHAGFLGGGSHNLIDYNSDTAVLVGGSDNYIGGGKWSFLGGGLGNSIVAPFSAIVGGTSNTLNSPYGTITGGELNHILTMSGQEHSVIGGGLSNAIDSTSQSAIVGGTLNLIRFEGDNSFIGGGKSNDIEEYYCTIAGGEGNRILEDGQHGTIGGGSLNTIAGSGWCSVVGGGQLNTVYVEHSTIAGGMQNRVDTNGEYSAIPGGIGLNAQSYAQFVAGRYNVPMGSSMAVGPVHPDDPLGIFGNGTDDLHRSNAVTFANKGYMTVYGENDNTSTSPQITPFYGSTYKDNTITAWGDIPAGTGSLFSTIGYNATADVGVQKIFHPHVGVYIVCLTLKAPITGFDTLKNASITVTRREEDANLNDTTAFQGLSCGSVTVTGLNPTLPAPWNGLMVLPITNWFIVRTYGDLTGSPCTLWDHGFYFKICGRLH